MRIVIDIQDELVEEWGTLYIHNPQYDSKKVVILLPGFKCKKVLKGEKPPIVLNILKGPTNNAQKQAARLSAPDQEPAEIAPEKETVPQDFQLEESESNVKSPESVLEITEPVVVDTAPVADDNLPPPEHPDASETS